MTARTVCLCAVLPVLCSAGRADVTVTTGREEHGGRLVEAITLGNEFLSLTILPERGGRVCRLLDKRHNRNLVHWPTGAKGVGGALDDHEPRSEAVYQWRVPERTAQRVSVELSLSVEDVTYGKAVTLEAGRPAVGVRHLRENGAQEEMARVQIRNFFRPFGEDVLEGSRYYLPSVIDVRERTRTGRSFARGEFGDNIGMATRFGAPWLGFLHQPSKTGLAFAFLDDRLRGFYVWGDSQVYPTYEFFLKPVPAGQRVEAGYLIILTDGLSGYAGATARCVTDLDVVATGREVSIRTAVYSASAVEAELTCETEIVNDGGNRVAALEPVELGSLASGSTVAADLTWTAPGDGVFVVRQRVVAGGELWATQERPVTVGTADQTYRREIQYTAEAQPRPIEGWVKKERVEVKPTEEDRQRGYAIWSRFVPESGRHLSRIGMTLGRGEFESFELNYRAFKEQQDISVTVEFPAAPVRVRVAEVVESKGWTFATRLGKKLLDQQQFTPAVGRDTHVWFTLDGRELASGSHRGWVTFAPRPADEPASRVELVVEVRPVNLPRTNSVSFEAEHLMNYLSNAKDRLDWDVELGRHYARDLAEHGVDFLQVYAEFPRLGRSPRWSKVKLREDGSAMAEQVDADALRFREGPLPELDFSYWDPLFDMAIEEGLIRVSTMLGYVPDEALKLYSSWTQRIHGKVDPMSPSHARIRRWAKTQVANYIRERGYPAVWGKHDDETPHDKYHQLAVAAAESVECGYKVYVTTSSDIMDHPVWLGFANPYISLWQIGVFDPARINARLADGRLDRTDEIWSYTGSMTHWRSYEYGRTQCAWSTAIRDLDGYHMHEYIRWNQNAQVVFRTDEGPVSSGTWEGCRDGAEDARFIGAAKQQIAALARRGEAHEDLVVAAREQLDAICSLDDSSLIPARYAGTGSHGNGLNVPAPPPYQLWEAKKRLLSVLERLAPAAADLPRALRWGSFFLVRDGEAQVTLHHAGAPGAADILARAVSPLCAVSVRPTSTPLGDGSAVLVGVAGAPEVRALTDSQTPGRVTDHYPAPGRYAVLFLDHPLHAGSKVLLLVGGDTAGADKGARLLSGFFRTTVE